MKELKNAVYHSEDFNVDINCYLTYAQIQQIIEASIKFDSWAERNQNIDMLVLYHATNLTKEEIEEIGHDMIVQSGLMDEVSCHVKNLYQIYEGIEYTESMQRAMRQLAENMPNMIKPLQDVVKKYGAITKSK